MGFEVELKFRVADPGDLARRLAERTGTVAEAMDHADIYFAHPSRDFAQTGEAFRIRAAGDANRITYKGAKRTGPTKTREEIELDFARGVETREELQLVFERLGFTVVATVRKRRASYPLTVEGRAMTVVVDHVDSLGDFAEVETLVDGEADLAPGQAAVVALARDLRLGEAEPRSYLRMVLEAADKMARNPAGQT